MYPAFTTFGQDYAVNGCSGKKVSVDVGLNPGAKLYLNGARASQRALNISMKADQVYELRASLGKIQRSWFIRCLPDDFPEVRVKQHQKPKGGYYLFSTGLRLDANRWAIKSAYYIIVDERGAPVWYMRATGFPGILDRAVNGNLLTTSAPGGLTVSYSARGEPAVVETTLRGKVVAEHDTNPDDLVDGHSFQVLPNGNLLLLTVPVLRNVDLSDDFAQLQPLDVAGGGLEGCDVTNVRSASVAYPAIREVTPSGEIVWSWNSWEHLDDAESIVPALTNISLTGGVDCVVDIFHANSISLSADGQTVLLTARFASATWGISRDTGLVRWKLGGIKTDKSLKISGDPYGEYGPRGHHGGVLDSNGRLLIFDNRRSPSEISRGVLYKIDTDRKQAVFERALIPPQQPCLNTDSEPICIAYSMGAAFFTPTGGTLVTWGYKPGNPNVATEFDRNGNPILSILNHSGIHNTYQVVRVDPSSWTREELRRAASSKRSINPPWESSLDDTSPLDTAVWNLG